MPSLTDGHVPPALGLPVLSSDARHRGYTVTAAVRALSQPREFGAAWTSIANVILGQIAGVLEPTPLMYVLE